MNTDKHRYDQNKWFSLICVHLSSSVAINLSVFSVVQNECLSDADVQIRGDGHDRRLDACATVVRQGAATAYEAARALTWTRRERHFDDLDPFNQMMAVMETGAHLDVLVRQGRLRE